MYEGIAGVYDDVVGDLPYGQWADFVESAWRPDPVPVRRVLDLCCGTGLLTAELIRRGYSAVGTDGSAAMLEEARALLGPEVPLARCVLPALDVDGPFDAVVSTFDSLNYLPRADLAATLVAVAARLRSGGWFVLDLHTIAMMRTIAAAPISEARSGALDLRMESTVDLEARTATTHVVVTPDGGAPFTELHRQYFFTEAEVRHAAAEAGLAVVGVTDDYTAEPLDEGSLRATWVLRRP